MLPIDLCGSGIRVLIIDEHRMTAGVFRRFLEVFGYDVRVAHTGPEALRLAEECPPNVVLCDIGLAGLEGWEVATTLRRIPETASARLIAVTAYDSAADRRRSQEVGFDQYVVKPLNPAMLLEMLAT